jgi:Ca2+-binding RTX toxin-like protein
MATITNSFTSLTNLNNTRQALATANLNLFNGITNAYNSFNNAFSSSYSTYDTLTSTKVAGYLSNGDYGIAYGQNLMFFPMSITRGDYLFVNSNVAVTFYGAVAMASAYSYPTGYLNKIIVSSGNDSVSISGYVDVSGNQAGSISSFEIKTPSATFSATGNLSVSVNYNSATLTLSGDLTSMSLNSGTQNLQLSGIKVDVMSLSKYADFNDFLAATMSGNDNVTGGSGAEYLMGYAGNDNLSGDYGDDTLDGGTGNDILDGGADSNTSIYNDYKSSYSVSKSGATYSVSNLFEGTDTLTNIAYLQFADGTVAIDDALPKPVITKPPVVIETPKPVTPPVVIEKPKTVISTIQTNGDDLLTGTKGNDTMSGVLGNDTLIGGLGADQLQGHKGADVFQFNDINESGITAKTRDTITDFKSSDGDKIDLSAIDANTSKTGNQAFTKLDIGAKFSGKFAATGQLFFDTATHILWGNVDTKSGADFSIQLNGVSSLVVGDFVL